jgi:hypothetical protein
LLSSFNLNVDIGIEIVKEGKRRALNKFQERTEGCHSKIRELDLFQGPYQFRIIVKMAIGLKIIAGFVLRSKKDEFHS